MLDTTKFAEEFQLTAKFFEKGSWGGVFSQERLTGFCESKVGEFYQVAKQYPLELVSEAFRRLRRQSKGVFPAVDDFGTMLDTVRRYKSMSGANNWVQKGTTRKRGCAHCDDGWISFFSFPKLYRNLNPPTARRISTSNPCAHCVATHAYPQVTVKDGLVYHANRREPGDPKSDKVVYRADLTHLKPIPDTQYLDTEQMKEYIKNSSSFQLSFELDEVKEILKDIPKGEGMHHAGSHFYTGTSCHKCGAEMTDKICPKGCVSERKAVEPPPEPVPESEPDPEPHDIHSPEYSGPEPGTDNEPDPEPETAVSEVVPVEHYEEGSEIPDEITEAEGW